MKKRLISIIAAGILGVQALAVPMLANAEESQTYVNKSDFSDVAIGGLSKSGPNGSGYYGLGIIIDGSPWLSKGSASVHYQTYSYDEQRKVNYVNMYSNSDKTGGNDGAGSMYMYNRNLTNGNQMGPFGLVEFDVRIKADSQDFNFMMGWFEDPTSGGFNASKDVALNIRFGLNEITATNGLSTDKVATLKADKWYKVRVTLNNKLEEYNLVITDVDTGSVVGSLESAVFGASKPAELFGIKTTCWGYIRGNTYNYDLTNVTIAKSDTAFPMQ